MNKQLESLMQKPVTRKQFLGQIGFLVLGLLGLNSFLSILNNPHKHLDSGRDATHGFGSGKFGA